MNFIADLHLHSHFSRATARNLDLENLYVAAQLKGITLVGTGDFTHPGWLSELETKLIPAEPGLFRLDPNLARDLDAQVPDSCRGEVRFMLQTEISSIYKKDGRVRKNHNLIYLPDLDRVREMNRRLDRIGNLASDGRPILGLDAERLLEMTLEISDDAFLVPAHIWTPWFSMFGSKSGFDSIEECFGSLSSHIFAVETGLSSDPAMNWRVAELDRVTLVANSDAHSPMFLGRNASVFTTDLSFGHVREALRTAAPDRYQGTLDMYPEEGKYHCDGHRKCGVCLTPEETRKMDGICPECGRPLTLGVLYRVSELASRPPGYTPKGRPGFKRMIPLADILSEILEVGPKTKKVSSAYTRALEKIGPELTILIHKDPAAIDRAGIPLLAEAVSRMRSQDIVLSPGFDGEFGKVKIFTPEERARLTGDCELFKASPETAANRPARRSIRPRAADRQEVRQSGPGTGKASFRQAEASLPDGRSRSREEAPGPAAFELNPEQRQAVLASGRPLLIEAGPGTGKTRTLTEKIAHLIGETKVAPESILALTFTIKAAREMTERLERALPGCGGRVFASTFHAFCLAILKEYLGFDRTIIDETQQAHLISVALARAGIKKMPSGQTAASILRSISLAKQQCLTPESSEASPETFLTEPAAAVWPAYQALLDEQNLTDYDDLIAMSVHRLESDPALVDTLQNRFSYLFVDEYQDINLGQYRLVRLLAGTGEKLFAIGDPDQSIYGFRGSDNRFFHSFITDFPGAQTILLSRNYRSSASILQASFQLITQDSQRPGKTPLIPNTREARRLVIHETATDRAEAVFVGKTIEQLVGGLSMLSMDSGAADGLGTADVSFSDIAVLYRTHTQGDVIGSVFSKAGIPFQTANRQNLSRLAGIRELVCLARTLLGRGTVEDLATSLGCMGAAPGKSLLARFRTWAYESASPCPRILEAIGPENGPEFPIPRPGRLRDAAGQLHECLAEAAGLDTAGLIDWLASIDAVATGIRSSDDSRQTLERIVAEASRWPGPAAGFFENLCLGSDPESLSDTAEAVSLMTVHAAKGLEFKVVFITGCETGLIPFTRQDDGDERIDEERRLFYVAMTRAKSILYLTYALKRRIYNRLEKREKSIFLQDIEDRLKEFGRTAAKARKKETGPRQLDLFG